MASPAPISARRAQIEADVLRATEELLRSGAAYSELNIERIATRAGISRTAFYFYFRDKRELLMRVTEDVSDLLFDVADGWWSGSGDGATELTEALERVVGVYSEHGTLLRAVVEASATDPEIASFWRDLIGRFVDATRRRIEGEQAAGRVRADLPAEGVAYALTWMTERTSHQHTVEHGDADPGRLATALVATWLGAIYGSRT